MTLRRRGLLKLSDDESPPESRTIRAQDTALYQGALMEIKRLDGELEHLKAENLTLRSQIIRSDRLADMHDDYMRGEA